MSRLETEKQSTLFLLFQCAAVIVVALISRSALLDHPPIYDELYQMLPAVSWDRNGTFDVLDGEYSRSGLFTQFVAFSFGGTSEYEVSAARFWPSAVPGALLVGLVFFWAYRVCGKIPALFAAVLMVFWPNGIEVSQYVRFYALQGLVFMAAALLVYMAVLSERINVLIRAVCVVVSLLLLYFALKLQVLTALSAACVCLWVAVFVAPGWLRREPRLWWLVGLGVSSVVAVLATGVLNDTIVWAWTTYNWEPWPVQNDTTFYHRNFRSNYATFWPLFPIIGLVALRANFWPASFCLTVFGAAFVLHSFGGLKNIRYLYSTMPLFFVLCGIAAGAVLPTLWTYLREAAVRSLPENWPANVKGGLGAVAVIFGFAFLLAGNNAIPTSAKLMLGKDENTLLGKQRWAWTDAQAMIQPWIEKRALIVTSEEMRVVQYIGDFDLAFSKPRFSELLYSFGPDTQPFHKDFRTGRPLIGESSDMKKVIDCTAVGVFALDGGALGGSTYQDLITYAKVRGIRVESFRRRGMALIGWEHTEPPLDETCGELYDFGEDRAADRILDGRSKPQPIGSAASVR